MATSTLSLSETSPISAIYDAKNSPILSPIPSRAIPTATAEKLTRNAAKVIPKAIITQPHMSARDMAVLGTLLLNDGQYNGKKIISERYLSDMTTPHLKLDEKFGFMYYGYPWYKPYNHKDIYAAIGDSGNIIYVNKEINISVGVTGTFKPRINDWVEFIEQRLFPAILS